MFQKRYSKIILIILWIYTIGCTGKPVFKPSPNETVEELITNMPTSRITVISEAITEIPTLPLNEARQKVKTLLTDNNNCKLPCWWGITPGQTSWQNALAILGPLSMTGNLFNNVPEDGVIYVNPPAPTDEHGDVLFHTYHLRNGIVNSMEIYNFNFAQFTSFREIISDFGIPSEMYIRGYQDTGFRLALFYPIKGIFIEYNRTISFSDENIVEVCFEEAQSPFLYLWEKDHPLSLDEAITLLHIPTEDIPTFVSIDQALVNKEVFLEKMGNDEEDLCIETPKDLWPPQY